MKNLTKITVYVPVNGEQEKYVISDNDAGYFNGVIEQQAFVFTEEQLNELLSSIIKETLNVAAENAQIILKKRYDSDYLITDEEKVFWGSDYPDNCYSTDVKTDKQSILNQFDNVFNKLKV